MPFQDEAQCVQHEEYLENESLPALSVRVPRPGSTEETHAGETPPGPEDLQLSRVREEEICLH